MSGVRPRWWAIACLFVPLFCCVEYVLRASRVESSGCVMTYMRPTYVGTPMADESRGYILERYWEGTVGHSSVHSALYWSLVLAPSQKYNKINTV
jgi:hypothetical protein